jgi:thioredoxin reductase
MKKTVKAMGASMAGDVTDERQQRIAIAAGDGARATLSVSQYLAALDRDPPTAPAKLVAVPG